MEDREDVGLERVLDLLGRLLGQVGDHTVGARVTDRESGLAAFGPTAVARLAVVRARVHVALTDEGVR